MLETFGQLFGRLRGGLAIGVILVGALLAAATGVVGATVVAMGMISLPVMLRYGYSPSLSAGVIAASGTLGQVIPPSVVLIVLGDQLGVSVGDLFLGALVPGISLALMYMLYAAVVAYFNPEMAPALPAKLIDIPGQELARRVIQVMLPPLLLILVVLGSIFAGVATPTEAGSMGVLGALVLAAVTHRLRLSILVQALRAAAELTTVVIILLLGATLFSLVFIGLNGDAIVEEILLSLPGGIVSLLIFVNFLVFILGFFLELFRNCLYRRSPHGPSHSTVGISGHERNGVAGVVWSDDRHEFTDVFSHPSIWILAVLPTGDCSARSDNHQNLSGGGAVYRDFNWLVYY